MLDDKRRTFEFNVRHWFAALKDRVVIIVFLAGTLVSLLAADWVASEIHARNQQLFSKLCSQFLLKIQYRLDEYAHILYGGRGLFVASQEVDEGEWRAFVGARDLTSEFPGMAGLGFIKHDGEKLVVTFIEPNAPNRAVIGHDFYVERNRREAAQWSMRTGKPAMTRRVGLIQDPEKKPAFLFFLPIFHERGQQTSYSDQKVLGLIYAPIFVNSFMERIIEDMDDKFDLTVYDGPIKESGTQLMFDTREAAGKHASFSQTHVLETSGQKWTIEFRSRPSLFPLGDRTRPWSVLFAGMLITLLTSAIVNSLRSARSRAETLVARRTEELELANEVAMEAARSKSRFLANMSHEIRSPLTAIIGFTESLRDDHLEGGEAADALEAIMRNGEHLLRVINDILDFSKIEAGALQIELMDCSLVDLMSDVANIFQHRAEEKAISFNFEYVGAVPERIRTDPTRLKQILFNLIGNAIKFTARGKVEVHIRCEWSKERISFSIKDTGIGLSEEQREKLFKAFSQADTSTTREFGGTGLGLVISQQLATRLGGAIRVESELGSGSTFTTELETGSLNGVSPLTNNAIQSQTKAVQDAPQHWFCGRVLLAEDGPDNQRLISHLLRKQGLEVVIAENGKRAVDEAQAGSFDLILMDMQMPILDGYTATKVLRDLGVTVPIVALTANIMPADQKRCLDAGCSDFIGKPFKRQVFLQKISTLLPSRPEMMLPSNCDLDEDTIPIIHSFVTHLTERLELIQLACRENDGEALGAAIHRLRAAEMFGFGELSKIATKLEHETMGSDEFRAAITELEAVIRKILAAEPELRRRMESPGVGA